MYAHRSADWHLSVRIERSFYPCVGYLSKACNQPGSSSLKNTIVCGVVGTPNRVEGFTEKPFKFAPTTKGDFSSLSPILLHLSWRPLSPDEPFSVNSIVFIYSGTTNQGPHASRSPFLGGENTASGSRLLRKPSR